MNSQPVENNPPKPRRERPQGFLPMVTNTFDRYFISVIVLVAIHLLWFRFLEASLSIHIATILSLVIGYIIVRWG
jgi:predicted small integral membrane protein